MFDQIGGKSQFDHSVVEFKKLSDAALLHTYQVNQDMAKGAADLNTKDFGNHYEFLGLLHTEIERRGLTAPTIEEREAAKKAQH